MFDRRQPAAASFAYRNRPDTNARPPTPVFLNTSYRAALESPTFAIGPVAQIWMGVVVVGWVLALIRARSIYLCGAGTPMRCGGRGSSGVEVDGG